MAQTFAAKRRELVAKVAIRRSIKRAIKELEYARKEFQKGHDEELAATGQADLSDIFDVDEIIASLKGLDVSK